MVSMESIHVLPYGKYSRHALNPICKYAKCDKHYGKYGKYDKHTLNPIWQVW